MSALLSNPALLVGLIRAVLILLVTFGVAVTQAQQDSILELVGAVLAVMSLLLTGVTLTKTPGAFPLSLLIREQPSAGRAPRSTRY
jgi:hypothetical protein